MQASTTQTNDATDKESSNGKADKKLLRMQLSTQMLQKFLKEGKMEKLPSGSFRIRADALKELRDDSDDEEGKLNDTEQESESGSPMKSQSKETVTTGEPPKVEAQTIDEQRPATPEEDSSEPPTKKIKVSEENSKVNSDHDDAKPVITSVKSKSYSHNYLSDFNSSEDEDEDMVKDLTDSIADLAPPRPGGKLSKKCKSII